MKPLIRKNGERGNTMIEFAVVMPFWIAVLFGTIALGTNLTRSIQTVQTSRDLANMYARGTDFSSSSAGFQNLITGDGGASASLVQGMDLSNTGNAVIYLSQVRHVYSTDNDCASCANAGSDVFVNQVVFGNTSLFSSFLGTSPPSSDLDAHDNTKNPTTLAGDKTNQNALFPSTYVMPGNGTVAFVVEVFVASQDVTFLGFTGAGNYSRAVF
jgi:Flp pilus assembly protein TadG